MIRGTHPSFRSVLWQVRSSEVKWVNISYSTKAVTTKLNSAVTYNEQNSSMMANNHLFFQKVFDHKNLQGSHLWWGKIDYNVTWLSDHLFTEFTWQNKNEILSWNNACENQLGRMITYNEENPTIMSHEPLTTWSHEITWQNEYKISPYLQNPWPPNMAGRLLMIKGTHP